MVEKEIRKTDAKIRLGMLEESKRELLTKMAEHEKNLKILLTQIKTMQRLIEEAQTDMESEAKGKVEEMQDEIDRQTEVLEEMLEQTKTAKEDAKEIFGENITTQYKGAKLSYRINEDVLTTAASGASSNRLRELQYKSNWNDKDAADFFAIKDSINASSQYELNPFLQENVNETYRALQDVLDRQEEQIKKNYQTNANKQRQSEQFFKPLKLNSNISVGSDSINNSYKLGESLGSLNKTTSSNSSSGLEKKVDKK